METERCWQEEKLIYLRGRLRARAPANLPIDPGESGGALERALAFEQLTENRSLSTTGAFFMFIFGFGCGAFWTVVLGWIF